MYKLKEIKRALKVLEQYDFQFAKASKATRIKVRTIRSWYDRQKRRPLLTKPCVHTKKESGRRKKRRILDNYFAHGESCSIAVRVLCFY